jgi:hypothetical protein
MNRLLALFAALAFAVSIAAAQAEEAAGPITAVDTSGGPLKLEDGTMIRVAEGVSMDGLEPGTEVTVSYEEQDGELVATEVTPSN